MLNVAFEIVIFAVCLGIPLTLITLIYLYLAKRKKKQESKNDPIKTTIKNILLKYLRVEYAEQATSEIHDAFVNGKDLFFTDRNKHQFEIEWVSTNVIISGYFSGTCRTYVEMICVNLGYGNKMKSVTDLTRNHTFKIGDTVYLVDKPVIIKEFYIDICSDKIGACFEEKIGRVELNDIKP